MAEKFVKRLPAEAVANLEEKNAARIGCGLSPIAVKIRTCLSCGILFESLGNRTCGCTRTKPGE